MPSTRLPRLVGLLLSSVLVLGACASDEDPDPPLAEDPGDDDEPGTSAAPDDGSDEPDDGSGDTGAPEESGPPDLDVELQLIEVAAMDSPTSGAVGPDGVLYLAERAGTVHALGDDGLGEAVLDLSGQTTTGGERGLLGLAFAADGSEFYASYTDRNGDSVLAAYAVEDGEILEDQRRTLLTVEQPYANHNGGAVRIGPDELLYLGLGDGGGGGDPLENAQDTSTLLGSLLRIDPQGGQEPYTVPDDNPFVADEDAGDEIYAYGLRNPWRFSFDRDTGQLWIADVGQNAREEINVGDVEGVAGANFGWSLMEGTVELAGEEPEDHVPPVFEYETHGPRGCAITGGYVYRGEAIPELRGAYLYSDYCGGGLYAIVVEDGEVVDQAELSVSGDTVVSFAQDADGELYVLDFAGGVERIAPAA